MALADGCHADRWRMKRRGGGGLTAAWQGHSRCDADQVVELEATNAAADEVVGGMMAGRREGFRTCTASISM